MNVSINVPDDLILQLRLKGEDVPRFALEALTIEAYRSGAVTEAEVQRILDLPSRWDVDAFLKRARAYIDYDQQDLQQDIEAIRRLHSQ